MIKIQPPTFLGAFKFREELSQIKEADMKRSILIFLATIAILISSGCTQEVQNKLGRAVQNYTGTDGVLDIYAGEVLVKRFIKIDKISTAIGTSGNDPRAYRYGYGILDENKNLKKDPGEKKVYFEFSDYSTSYIFYENPIG